MAKRTERANVEAAWRSRSFNCDLWVDPPGRCWEDFSHAVDELIMVFEGVMNFEVAGRIRWLQSGEELIVPAGEARWLYNRRFC